MKLRNLFLASLAVCTMASCSKDDDGISGPQEVDAYLSFASTTDVMTKASAAGDDDAGNGKEAKIQSLTAYVFDTSTDNKYVISKHVSLEGSGEEGEDYNVAGEDEDKSITSIKAIHVKVAKPATDGGNSSTTFKVVLLANTEYYNDVTKLADLKGKTTQDITSLNAKEVGSSYLPMHSPELTVGGLKPSSDTKHFMNWYNGASSCMPEQATGKDNHKGDDPTTVTKVIMTRSISRVQLVSLNANFSALESAGKTIKFDVTSVFLANVRVNASVMGEENTEAAFYRGAPESFDELQFLIALNSTVDEELKAAYSDKSLTTAGDPLTNWNFDKYINANSPASIKGIPFTANGNGTYAKGEGDGAYQTRLIIAGNYYDGNQSKGTRYFHIPLKLVGDVGNVASNKFFKISATITGEGSPNPDEILENACINFNIEVDDWKVVNQTEEDTN